MDETPRPQAENDLKGFTAHQVRELLTALTKLKSRAWRTSVEQLMYQGNPIVRETNELIAKTERSLKRLPVSEDGKGQTDTVLEAKPESGAASPWIREDVNKATLKIVEAFGVLESIDRNQLDAKWLYDTSRSVNNARVLLDRAILLLRDAGISAAARGLPIPSQNYPKP